MDDLQNIQDHIYVIRGQRVMLDRDIAKAYGVETKVLNQAVKRNIKRFEGEDYMFQLTKEECLRSQIVTLDFFFGCDALRLAKLQIVSNGFFESVFKFCNALPFVINEGVDAFQLSKKNIVFFRKLNRAGVAVICKCVHI